LAEKPGTRAGGSTKTGVGKSTTEKSGKNHGKAKTSEESAPVPVASEVSVSNLPIVPAKLLRAVQPIYPPDAMRNYITGDVRIEAEVDKQGRIGAMKVLLGPKQFRQVAMDALRQYEYAPATQGGKPVASKVTVTIKFWFDP
jgi:TonB family protein